MKKDKIVTEKITQILYILNNHDLFVKQTINDYIRSDSEGVLILLLEGKKKLIAKITIDVDNAFKNCKNEKVISDLENIGVSYINPVKAFEQVEKDIEGKPLFFCVLILEQGDFKIDKLEIFSLENKKEKTYNSERLFRFFGKVIKSIAELNFKANVLHGNINTENIMYKFGDGIREMLPVVANFTQVLVNPDQAKLTDEKLRYNLKYRPPEMVYDKKAETTKDEAEFAKRWPNWWRSFKYSTDFVEDVYALGETINEVLKQKESYLVNDSCEISTFKDIYSEMVKERYRYEYIYNDLNDKTKYTTIEHKLRPNMREILDLFITKAKECVKSSQKTVHNELISELEASLASIPKPKNIIFI